MIVFHALEWDMFRKALFELRIKTKANPTSISLEEFGYPHFTLFRFFDGETESCYHTLLDKRVEKNVAFCVVTGKYIPTEAEKNSKYGVPLIHYKDNLYIVTGDWGDEEEEHRNEKN